MSSLEPPVALKDHCSIIYNNTLFVYSPDAFQSIPLQQNAQWSQLPNGVSVTGAQCVRGGIDGDHTRNALYVVGGSTNSSSVQYSGLQRYDLDNKKWNTISPVAPVTQNRQNHGVAYMNASSSLVIYAGSQDNNTNPSTQTFLVATYPPYIVQAYESAGAPPTVAPLMLPWTDSHAVMLGGGAQNTDIFTFGPDEGWENSGVSLANGLQDRTKVQCSLLSLDDGSKVLQCFDLSTSPNTITNTALLAAGGQPAPPGQIVGSPSSMPSSSSTSTPSRKRKRDLTLNDFPTINNTLASTTTRSGFSLAQGDSGLIVFTGGGSAQDPMTMFNSTQNSWLNATQFFNAKPSSTTSSTSTKPTSSVVTISSTSSPSSTSSSHHSHVPGLTILGAILGAACGLAAILIVALLALRHYRRKRELRERRSNVGFPHDNKDERPGIPDRENVPLSYRGEPMAQGPAPAHDSMAIMSGRAAAGQPILDPIQRDDQDFSKQVMDRTRSPQSPAEREIDRTQQSILDRSSEEVIDLPNRRTDEGWSSYFQGNNAMNLSSMQDQRSTYRSDDTHSRSDYRGSYWPHGSREIQPLALGRFEDGREVSNVPFASPSIEHPAANGRGTGLAVSEGMPAVMSSGDSHSGDDRDVDRADAFSSGVPASVHDDRGWDPISDKNYSSSDRTPSSTYTESVYPGTNRDTQISAFPMPGTSRPMTRWPDGNESQPPLSPPLPQSPANPRIPQASQYSQTSKPLKLPLQAPPVAPPVRPPRSDTHVVRDYFGQNPRARDNVNSDMSWLNLGNNR